VIAGRLAAAFRAIGQTRFAADILETMRAAGHRVEERNPFPEGLPTLGGQRVISPYVDRIRLMWERMRAEVIANFPAEPGRPADPDAYMQSVEEAYEADAYHSLS